MTALRTGRACALIFLFPLLVSCGGGGGGSAGDGTGTGTGTGAGTGTVNNYPLKIATTPSSLTGPLVEGVSEVFPVNAQVSGTVSTGNTVYVVIDDTSGVLQADKIQISQSSSSTYAAQLVTSTTLPVGEDKGNINVRVCSDTACSTVYGVTSVPYDFTVASATNTTGVSALSGAADWQTERGSSSQMSYVPITLDPSRFTVRWLQSNVEQMTPDGLVTGASIVTDYADQLVIVRIPTSYNFDTGHRSAGGLIAYSENDGTPIWHKTFTDSGGNQMAAGPLASSSGVVYTTQETIGIGYGGDVSFIGLSAKNGAVMFQTQISDTFSFDQLDSLNKGCTPGSPVAYGSMVFVNPGCIPDESGVSVALPIAAFDATSGQSLWSGAAPGGSLGTSFVLSGGDLYYSAPLAQSTPSLTDLYQSGGAIHWQTTFTDGVARMTPSLDGTGDAIVPASTSSGPVVDRYDLASGQLLWQITLPSPQPTPGGFQAMAVANGMIYVAYGAGSGAVSTVATLNLTDGSTAWSWSPPTSEFGVVINDMIVTNNLLFVSTDKGVYAVDLSTHKTVWTLPVPGYQMAISPSGMLYIVSATENYITASASYLTSEQALVSVNLH
jgi:outer membrane protein assembly factor BamB